eukprot:maker-scaffold_3-snap-gene-21.11-mRNA-1 protein AED:0.32 eAED:0.97 QI:0/0/0/0.8/0/0/5/0/172
MTPCSFKSQTCAFSSYLRFTFNQRKQCKSNKIRTSFPWALRTTCLSSTGQQRNKHPSGPTNKKQTTTRHQVNPPAYFSVSITVPAAGDTVTGTASTGIATASSLLNLAASSVGGELGFASLVRTQFVLIGTVRYEFNWRSGECMLTGMLIRRLNLWIILFMFVKSNPPKITR